MIIKGCNSGHNKITHNKGDFRDDIIMPKTTERIRMKITLRDNHDIKTTYEV